MYVHIQKDVSFDTAMYIEKDTSLKIYVHASTLHVHIENDTAMYIEKEEKKLKYVRIQKRCVFSMYIAVSFSACASHVYVYMSTFCVCLYGKKDDIGTYKKSICIHKQKDAAFLYIDVEEGERGYIHTCIYVHIYV